MNKYFEYLLIISSILPLLLSPINGFNIEDYNESAEIECLNYKSNFTHLIYLRRNCKNYNSSFRIEKTEQKGFGLFANRRILKGELIFIESPLMVFGNEVYNQKDLNSWLNVIEFKQLYLNQLIESEREEFFSLIDAFKTNSSSEESTIEGIVYSNSFQVEDQSAIIPKSSRINHSCRPNCEYAWYEYEQTLHLFASRDIEPNEELTISYINNYQDRKSRQEKLKSGYNFICTCELCSSNLTGNEQMQSDLIRNKINDGINNEHDDLSPEKMIRYMEHLRDLAVQENLQNDSYVIGHIYYIIVKSLLKLDDYRKHYTYDINELASYAVTNLSVSYGFENLYNEFPVLEEFTYLI